VSEADETSELDQAVSERDDYLDQLQRLAADFSNYRKRIERQQAEARRDADQQLLGELLSVLDNLDLAREHSAHHDQLIDGVRLTGERLEGVLARRGMERVADGGAFDPHVHEALMTEDAEGVPAGQVLRTLRCGWRIDDRVLRHAQVVVSS
jgi:molecular chaperone GrpE